MFNLLHRTIITSRAIALVLLLLATAACLACNLESEIEPAARSGSDEERRERASDTKVPFGLTNNALTAKIAPTLNAAIRTNTPDPDHKKPFGLPTERPAVATTTIANPTQTASAENLAGNKISIGDSQLALVPNNATGVGIIDMNSPFLLSLLALYDTEGHEAELAFHLEVFKELFDSDTITFATFEKR